MVPQESEEVWRVVNEILMCIPKPNYDELPQLYLVEPGEKGSFARRVEVSEAGEVVEL